MPRSLNLLSKEDFGCGSYWTIRHDVIEGGDCKGVYLHNSITEEIAHHKPIYRYYAFQYLIELLEKKQLFVPSRQKFSDLREHSDSYCRSIDEIVRRFNIVPNHRQKKSMRLWRELAMQIWNQPISCWTFDSHTNDGGVETNENYLLWKCHADKQLVCRIESTIADFANSIVLLNHDIIASSIDYVDVERFRIYNPVNEVFEKPSFYVHEDEFRFVVLHNEESYYSKTDNILLDVNPFKLINKITLSPFVSPEIEKLMQERLLMAMGDNVIPVKKSMLMEYIV